MAADMPLETHLAHLRRAIAVSARARANGNHPFGAILVSTGGEVLLEAENTVITTRDPTGHAETNLVRLAGQAVPRLVLEGCTLYTSTEPCAMCAGAIYWAGIGRVVYALSETSLYAYSPRASDDYMALEIPCREVFARGRPAVAVLGPYLEAEAWAVHEGFWGING